jgi:hypothetical protein
MIIRHALDNNNNNNNIEYTSNNNNNHHSNNDMYETMYNNNWKSQDGTTTTATPEYDTNDIITRTYSTVNNVFPSFIDQLQNVGWNIHTDVTMIEPTNAHRIAMIRS